MSQPVLLVHLLLILALAAALFPALPPGAVVGGGWEIKLLSLGRMALLLVLATLSLGMRRLGWSELGLSRPRWGRFFLALIIGLALALTLVFVANLALRWAGVPPADYSMFRPLKGNLDEYLYWAIPVTLGSAALGEEMLFRGYVRDALQRLIGKGAFAFGLSVLLQAVVFGALHAYQGLGGVATAGAIGLAFGVTWLIAGRNLWAGIVLHALFDLGAITSFYLGVAR